jgi:LacI family transcriptional regulator
LFRPETRQRVLDTARSMGYRPNSSARAVRKGKFDCLALLLSTHPNVSTVPTPLLIGINDEVTAAGLHFTLARFPDEQLTNDGAVPKIIQQLLADGLLIDYTHQVTAKMIELIRDYRIPSVWLNSKLPADCVYPDDFDAGRRATEYLLSLGHRRIAFVGFIDSAHYSLADRRAGYESAMGGAGLALSEFGAEGFVPEKQRVEVALEILRRADRPTAIFGYSALLALPFVQAADRLGLKMPEDLSFIVCDGKPFDYLGPTFTTMMTPDYEVGRQAVRMVQEKVAKPTRPLPARAVKFELVKGDTCVAPNS